MRLKWVNCGPKAMMTTLDSPLPMKLTKLDSGKFFLRLGQESKEYDNQGLALRAAETYVKDCSVD